MSLVFQRLSFDVVFPKATVMSGGYLPSTATFAFTEEFVL
jgi:hypothetical protein